MSELDAALEQASRGRSATGASLFTPAAAFTSQLTRFASTLVTRIDTNGSCSPSCTKTSIVAVSTPVRVAAADGARGSPRTRRAAHGRGIQAGRFGRTPGGVYALLVGMVKATAQSTFQRQQAMSTEGTATDRSHLHDGSGAMSTTAVASAPPHSVDIARRPPVNKGGDHLYRFGTLMGCHRLLDRQRGAAAHLEQCYAVERFTWIVPAAAIAPVPTAPG